jgi:hypothetical protein
VCEQEAGVMSNEGGGEVGVEVAKVTVWIVARDASGAPAITRWEVGATEQELEHGYHYDIASDLAREQGYGDPMVAFDESDPAGRTMLALTAMQSTDEQSEVPGSAGDPTWEVTVTTMATLSARVRVRASSREQAIDVATDFVGNGKGSGLLSLDEGNYKGASDFFCADPDGVERVEHVEEIAEA